MTTTVGRDIVKQNLAAILLFTLLAGGCATTSTTPPQPVRAIQAIDEIPENQLLDVGIRVLDPGLPPEDLPVPEDVFPELRKAEARYFPYHLKNTLQGTGQWGAVRVLPGRQGTTDLEVSGRIWESTGSRLILQIRAVDAAGRVWLDRRYKGEADSRAYAPKRVDQRDPFQNIYNEIANDLIEARQKLRGHDLVSVRDVSRMRFAIELAPDAFSDHLEVNRKGRASLQRLPAADDPMMQRVDRIRLRNELFVDTLDQHYATFYSEMNEPYINWRRYSWEEQLALDELKRKALTQKVLGALAVLGAMFADVDSRGEAAIRDAAAFAGMAAIQAGMATSQEAKIHAEALIELAASFESEVEPLVLEVEGQTLRLSGSAETQYETWRRLLRELWSAETGRPQDPNSETTAPEVATVGS